MYSSQPEESTRASSEAVISIPVVVLPLHALGDPAKVFDGSGLTKANASVQYVNDEFLTRLELKLYTHTLGDDDLELRRYFHGFQGFALTSILSISARHVNSTIDSKTVIQASGQSYDITPALCTSTEVKISVGWMFRGWR